MLFFDRYWFSSLNKTNINLHFEIEFRYKLLEFQLIYEIKKVEEKNWMLRKGNAVTILINIDSHNIALKWSFKPEVKQILWCNLFLVVDLPHKQIFFF